MKKFMTIIAMIMAVVATNAQSAKELAKEQLELNKVNAKLLKSIKPNAQTKKDVKRLKKEGWMVQAGAKAMEIQFTEAQNMETTLMKDEAGNTVSQYIMQPGTAVGGTYTAAYNQALMSAQQSISQLIETKIAAAMQSKVDNEQTSAITTVTVDKFHQRAKAVSQATLTRAQTVVTIYRVLPNHNYEVQLRLAYDKQEFAAQLKRKLQKELEAEGDELNAVVDEALSDF